MQDSTSNIGKIIFNLQRFQILQAKINLQTANRIPDSYAYAWYQKVFPLLHNDDTHQDLEKYFTVTRKQIELISDYADSEWLAKRLYNFYEYEIYFRNKKEIGRPELICAFRYFYLCGGFDKAFWEKLLEPMMYPSEAGLIIRKFDIDQIHFT